MVQNQRRTRPNRLDLCKYKNIILLYNTKRRDDIMFLLISRNRPRLESGHTRMHNLRQSSLRIGDDCVQDRCGECGVVLETYTNEELGLCLVALETFIHREPG